MPLAHNPTPHAATGFPPFFLPHGWEAPLDVQRCRDEQTLGPMSVARLQRLWRPKFYVEEEERQGPPRVRKVSLRPTRIGAVRASAPDMGQYPTKKKRPDGRHRGALWRDAVPTRPTGLPMCSPGWKTR